MATARALEVVDVEGEFGHVCCRSTVWTERWHRLGVPMGAGDLLDGVVPIPGLVFGDGARDEARCPRGNNEHQYDNSVHSPPVLIVTVAVPVNRAWALTRRTGRAHRVPV